MKAPTARRENSEWTGKSSNKAVLPSGSRWIAISTYTSSIQLISVLQRGILLLGTMVLTWFLIILICSTSVEGAKQQLPEGQIQCDPNVQKSCELVQTGPNNSSSTARQGSDADQTRPSDSIKTDQPSDAQGYDTGENKTSQTTGSGPTFNPSNLDMNKIKVTFDSFKVLADYQEPANRGMHYILYAYIQGKKILLYETYPPFPATPGHPPVYVHRTYAINKEVTVDVPEKMPLSIMTVGYEKDECPDFRYPDDVRDKIIKILEPPILDNLPRMQLLLSGMYNNINALCVQDADQNDPLGYINKLYYPASSYGAGVHEDKVSGNFPEFSIKYRISVTPPIMLDK